MRRVEVGIGIATRYFKGKNWQAAVFEIYAQDFITLTKDCQEHAG